MKIKTIIHNAQDGGYWAEVPALPGCVTQGETVKEVKENVKDAAAGWIKANEAGRIGEARKLKKTRILSVPV